MANGENERQKGNKVRGQPQKKGSEREPRAAAGQPIPAHKMLWYDDGPRPIRPRPWPIISPRPPYPTGRRRLIGNSASPRRSPPPPPPPGSQSKPYRTYRGATAGAACFCCCSLAPSLSSSGQARCPPMETSLRLRSGGGLRIHAKEKLPLGHSSLLQVQLPFLLLPLLS